ncbi:MAG: pyruvate dehydrogenase complex E1 component subunit beta [Alphaproteobacteria bacterium]
MPVEVLMPALSPTMTEGKLARWLKAEGEEVRSGDAIAEIETDKATMEVEAVEEGTLARILVPEGAENVPVNQVIALLLAEGEDATSLDGFVAPAPAADGSPAAPPEQRADASPPAAIAQPSAPPAPAEEAYSGPSASMTLREALRDAMAEEMRRDDTVFLMGEEVAEYQGAYKVSQGMLEEFGAGRIIDTPITEHGFTGLGVGAAFAGLRPIVEFMTWNFAMQGIDQIINSAAKTRYMSGGQIGAPIVFRGANGAASRVAAQHSQDYSSWYAHCPGLIVIAPYSAADAKGLLKSAIRNPNPVVFLENEMLYGRSFEDVPSDPEHLVPIGRARIAREGGHVTITAFSRMVEVALEAADLLAGEGIEAEIIDLRTLRPLDTACIVESVKKTNRLVSIEEGWPTAGMGAEISATIMEQAFDWLDAPVTRVTGADVPMPYAANLEALALPQAANIVAAVKSVLYRG